MNRIDVLRKNIADDEAVLISSYPNIFYYSSFTSEDARLLISKEAQILFTDSRYTSQAHEQSPDFEVFDIFSDFDRIVKSLDKKTLLIEEDNITVKQFSKLQTLGMKTKPFSDTLKAPRRIKDDKEIECIRQAQSITDDGFSYILNHIKPGVSEKAIADELEFYMRKKGAEKMSFETVCASGVRSCMPHGVASDKIIRDGDFLTLDFGCVIGGYCSDMTRTVAIGYATDKMREIYDIVLNAQKNALEIINRDILCKDVDAAARDLIKASGYGENFGHGTGHSVGIEIHELPSLSPKSDDILTIGNVVTVEPGIYIDGWGGVRIEDLIQISTNGAINLTKSVKDLLII